MKLTFYITKNLLTKMKASACSARGNKIILQYALKIKCHKVFKLIKSF